MTPDAPDDDVALTLRHASSLFPEALVEALLSGESGVRIGPWVETQLAARQRRLDRGLEVQVRGQRRILHPEWQARWEADLPFRLFEYPMLHAIALHEQAPPGEPPPTIETTLVRLSGREEPWPATAEYRTSPPGAPFAGLTFRIDAVHQRSIAELTRRGVLWAMFAPLARYATPLRLQRVLERLGEKLGAGRRFAELATGMLVLAEADGRQRGLRGAILSRLSDEVVKNSWVYQQGVEKGLEQNAARGLSLITRQFERRLARALRPDERQTLVARLAKLGPERLGDVVLDLSPADLDAWLADPAAR